MNACLFLWSFTLQLKKVFSGTVNPSLWQLSLGFWGRRVHAIILVFTVHLRLWRELSSNLHHSKLLILLPVKFLDFMFWIVVLLDCCIFPPVMKVSLKRIIWELPQRPSWLVCFFIYIEAEVLPTRLVYIDTTNEDSPHMASEQGRLFKVNSIMRKMVHV